MLLFVPLLVLLLQHAQSVYGNDEMQCLKGDPNGDQYIKCPDHETCAVIEKDGRKVAGCGWYGIDCDTFRNETNCFYRDFRMESGENVTGAVCCCYGLGCKVDATQMESVKPKRSCKGHEPGDPVKKCDDKLHYGCWGKTTADGKFEYGCSVKRLAECATEPDGARICHCASWHHPVEKAGFCPVSKLRCADSDGRAVHCGHGQICAVHWSALTPDRLWKGCVSASLINPSNVDSHATPDKGLCFSSEIFTLNDIQGKLCACKGDRHPHEHMCNADTKGLEIWQKRYCSNGVDLVYCGNFYDKCYNDDGKLKCLFLSEVVNPLEHANCKNSKTHCGNTWKEVASGQRDIASRWCCCGNNATCPMQLPQCYDIYGQLQTCAKHEMCSRFKPAAVNGVGAPTAGCQKPLDCADTNDTWFTVDEAERKGKMICCETDGCNKGQSLPLPFPTTTKAAETSPTAIQDHKGNKGHTVKTQMSTDATPERNSLIPGHNEMPENKRRKDDDKGSAAGAKTAGMFVKVCMSAMIVMFWMTVFLPNTNID